MLNRIPKSWILLAVFIVSVMGVGAWVYTTPPDYTTNQTGDWFGNTSNNGNNYTSDRIAVMNYFGTVVGTYLDSYNCGGSFCIYTPWYDSSNYYVKNSSSGAIEKITTKPSGAIDYAVLNIPASGEIKLIGNFNFNNDQAALINSSGIFNRITVDLSGASLYNNSNGLHNRSWNLLKVDGGNVCIVGGTVEGSIVFKGDASTIQLSCLDKTSILADNITALQVSDSTYRVYESVFSPVSIRSVNYTSDTASTGIHIDASDNTFTGMTIAKHYGGIVSTKGGNRFSNIHQWGSRDGITFTSSTGGLDTLSGSYIEDNSRNGVLLNSAMNITIIGNTFSSNGQQQYHTGAGGADVAIWGTSNNTLVSDNIFMGTAEFHKYTAKSPSPVNIADSAGAIIQNNMMNGNYTNVQISSSTTGVLLARQNYGTAPYDFGRLSNSPAATGAGDTYFNLSSNQQCWYMGSTLKFRNATNQSSWCQT